MAEARPVTVLISALGGEGGGVMTDWILAAARDQNLICQATSVPGVAQRTGATTYYIEVFREQLQPGKPEPVMALYPQAGDIDLMVATELAEAGRASAERLHHAGPHNTDFLVASLLFARREDGHGATAGSMPSGWRRRRARWRSVPCSAISPMPRVRAGTVINAVMLGAIAGSRRDADLRSRRSRKPSAAKAKGSTPACAGSTTALAVARGEVV